MTDPSFIGGTVSPGGETVPTHCSIEQKRIDQEGLKKERMALAYCYARETKADSDIANVLTMDEARRIAANIAKLPTLLGRES